MKIWGDIKSGLAWAFAAILLLAMFSRAIMPTGYMLTTSSDGSFATITLCTGYGPTEAVLDFRSGTLVDADHAPAGNEQNMACPFATFSYAAVATEPPVALVIAFHTIPPTVQRVDTAPVAAAVAALPWATGPPAA